MKMLDTIKTMLDSKKGMAKMGSGMKSAVAAVLLIVLVAALLPVAFHSIFGFNATEVPSWVTTVLQIGVGVVFIWLVLKEVE